MGWFRSAGRADDCAIAGARIRPVAVLMMNGDLRFFLALLVGTASGFGLVWLWTRAGPYAVCAAFLHRLDDPGAVFCDPRDGTTAVGSAGLPDEPPAGFFTTRKSRNLLAWFSGNNSTVDIIGVTFPSYRIFIILLGIIMFIGLILLMQRTRIGMIIRAGVQDREMVEALGINVQAVFLLVFALGTAMAALGGIGAAPFIPVSPQYGRCLSNAGFHHGGDWRYGQLCRRLHRCHAAGGWRVPLVIILRSSCPCHRQLLRLPL